ncbi:MAG: hypothetical protein ACI815_000931 [Psychroserpens sp.]|jgi:hypothetical protein
MEYPLNMVINVGKVSSTYKMYSLKASLALVDYSLVHYEIIILQIVTNIVFYVSKLKH